MSYNATDWAMAMPISPSAKKFLLVVLAYCADRDTAMCHPSIAHLADTTSQDRKTVISNLKELEKDGLILDTGRRVGRTGQVKEYRLSISENANGTTEKESQNRNSSNNGTVPFFPAKSTVFPRKEYQKRDTEQVSEQVSEQVVAEDQPPVSSKAADSCPYQAIVDLYHEAMPNNPRCKIISKPRKAAIKARWQEASKLTCKPFGYDTREEGLAAWKQFFEICADSDFLTGQVPGTNGRPPFVAGIDFLTSPSGFAKTLENTYHRTAEPGAGRSSAGAASQDALFRGAI